MGLGVVPTLPMGRLAVPCDPECPLRRWTLINSPESPQPWGTAWSLRAHVARWALAQSWSVGSKRWAGSAIISPRGGPRSAVAPVNLKAHGLSKAPHLGHPRSPSSPSGGLPPRKGRNTQDLSPAGHSRPQPVAAGRGPREACLDRGSPPGLWSLARPQHSPTSEHGPGLPWGAGG